MPIPVQYPGQANALQKLFGLKGKIPLSVDETIVPVALIADQMNSPWGDVISVARHRAQAALAANNSGLMVRPGAGVVLGIDQIFVDNNQGNAVRIDLRMLSVATVTAMTVVASSNMNDMSAPIASDGSIARTGSVVSSITRIGATGNVLARINIAANESDVFKLGAPFYLDGSAKAGIGALAIWNLTLNEPIGASFIGREYVHRA